MKCPNLATVAVYAGLVLHTQAGLAADPREVFAQLRPAVLQLEMRNQADVAVNAHTAIVIARMRVISACHILDGEAVPTVVAGKQAFKATVSARDLQRNLCLLDVPGLEAPAARMAEGSGMPGVGARVYAMSNALGLGVGITEGVVSGIREVGERRYIQFSAAISPGSEGGALVNDNGQIVGIIDYRHRDGQNVNFAAPAAWIAEVEGRYTVNTERQQFIAQVTELAREKKWVDVMKQALEWSTLQGGDLEALRLAVFAARTLGDLDAEEKAWRDMRRIDPVMVSAGVGLSQVLLRRKQAEPALALARSLLALRQEDPDVWVAIGQAELTLNRIDRADEAYRRAMSLSPWADGAAVGMVAVAEGRGDRAAITAAWQRVTQLFPDSTYAQNRLIDSLLRQRRPANALPLVERLLVREPNNGEVWYWKGAVMAALGRPADAIQAYRAALDKSPASPAYIWGALGETYFNLSLYPEAIAAYREAVKLSDGALGWRFWLAVALKDGGHLDEAIAMDEKMAAEQPDDPAPARQLAMALSQAGRHKEAIPAYERSLTLAPKQARIWHGLMNAYHAERRVDDMRRAYGKLRDLDTKEADAAYRALILPNEEPK